MPSAQAQAQPEALGFFSVTGEAVKAVLSATCEFFGLKMKPAAEVASIHIAHLPVEKSARFSLWPLAVAPGGPSFFITSRYQLMASFQGWLVSCGSHFMFNHSPPKPLAAVRR